MDEVRARILDMLTQIVVSPARESDIPADIEAPMNYYDLPPERREQLDYDLYFCLEYNPQSFTESDIANVLAVHEGKNDGENWVWVLGMKDGRFAYLEGSCDYTGWD